MSASTVRGLARTRAPERRLLSEQAASPGGTTGPPTARSAETGPAADTTLSLAYSIREGLAGFRRTKFASAASTSAMAVALILIGLFIIISYEAQEVSSWLRQRVGELEIFLEDEADDQLARALHLRADATAGIENAEFVSRQEAQQIFVQEFGEDGTDFFDEPFLQASIKVRVEPAYANPDSIVSLIRHFEAWERVDEVVFNQQLLLKVQENLKLVSTFGLWLGALVVLASIFLVANTVRLTIYARRLLIRTMKLVGATDAFIRRPFIIEGITQGLLAGIIAVLVLLGLYSFVSNYLPEVGDGGTGTVVLLVIAMVLLGVGLGFVGSYFAVRRFIRHVALH